jgi:hypothetical protein
MAPLDSSTWRRRSDLSHRLSTGDRIGAYVLARAPPAARRPDNPEQMMTTIPATR